uniref:Serpentine receptor class gamma n=1 Tax=Rhabditophanes sp. KR3021 TaxID=114890 RepID=A0AC35U9V2_9BILA
LIILNICRIILFIFELFSTILYVLLLIFLVKMLATKNSQIRKHFFFPFVFNGVFEIMFIIEEYITFRIPTAQLFVDFYSQFLSSMNLPGKTAAFGICLEILIAFFAINTAFNRFSSIYWPFLYTNLWSGSKLIMLTIWPFVLIVPYFFFIIQFPATYVLDIYNETLSLTYQDENIFMSIWYVLMIIHILCLITISILNFLLIRKLNQLSKGKVSKSEMILVKASIVNFVAMVCIASNEIFGVIATQFMWTNALDVCWSLYTLCETFLVFNAPYSLLILSKDIRSRFFIFIKFKKSIIQNASLTLSRNKNVI